MRPYCTRCGNLLGACGGCFAGAGCAPRPAEFSAGAYAPQTLRRGGCQPVRVMQYAPMARGRPSNPNLMHSCARMLPCGCLVVWQPESQNGRPRRPDLRLPAISTLHSRDMGDHKGRPYGYRQYQPCMPTGSWAATRAAPMAIGNINLACPRAMGGHEGRPYGSLSTYHPSPLRKGYER